MSRSSSSTAPRRTHGIMARLMRLAAGVLVVTLVLAALTAHSHAAAHNTARHVCIHEKLQRHAVATAQTAAAPTSQVLSPIGLPYVEAEEEPAAAEAEGGAAVLTAEMLAGASAPVVTRTVAWGEFRIATSTDDLTTTGAYCATVGQTVNDHQGNTVTCTEEDILTTDKRNTLVNYLLPEAIQLHTDRLQVKRVKSTWKVTGMSNAICANFKVPSSHLTSGLQRTDFMLYVASVPADAGVAAWAITCQVFSNDQPAVGVLNVPAAYINAEYDQQQIHAIAREIAHAIGFSTTYFQSTGVYSTVTGIRGKTYAAPVLNGANVVAKAQAHYGCSSMTYMELEDEGLADTVSSHWKARNAADELMAENSAVGYYTALTIAAFEDTGFYSGVYSKAENMTWGSNAGCTLLNDKCVVDGVSQFPSMFCAAEENVFRCAAGRLGLGSCEVLTYEADLATYFQYFSVATEGGAYATYDYCPSVVEASTGSCTQDASTAPDTVAVFNLFSPSSRCVDGSFTPQVKAGSDATAYYGMCVNVMCDSTFSTYTIKVHGASKYHGCTPGAKITLSDVSGSFEEGGYITCPTYAEVCQSNLQAASDYQASVDAAAGPRVVGATVVALLLAAITVLAL